MNRYIRIIVFIICFYSSFDLGIAQTGRFYTMENGLSSSLVNELLQDSRGFVWIATEYGLNRFDGIRFTNYRHVLGDSTTIKNNYVHTLFEDSRQNLFVGCIDGLMIYDRETDTFTEIPMVRAGRRVYPHVTQMCELHNGEVWIATTGQGMFRLNEKRSEAVSMDAILLQANYNYLQNFYEDSDHNIWIATDVNGLIYYEPVTRRSRFFRYSDINDNSVSSIGEDAQGNLFIGTPKGGLLRYDKQNHCFIPVPCNKSEPVSVNCMALVAGKLLVGTDGQGLKVYNPAINGLEDYSINSAPQDFSKGKIHAIMEDKDKNLWLGLFQKGIMLIPNQKNPFEYYGYKSTYYNPIGEGCVMSVFQDENYHLWVGADNEGLFELGIDGKRLHHYKPSSSPQSVANTIMCMFEDSNGDFWVGSCTRGLAKMDRNTGECEYLKQIGNNKVLSIAEDNKKNLYIATLGGGFFKYNLETKKLMHYESSKDETGDLGRNELANDWVNYLICDREGYVWLAHYKGISCFNPATNSFLNFKQTNTLITDCVGYALLEGVDGRIWAGTTAGLYCFDKKTEEFEQYTVKEGLPNDVICGLCEDGQHNIWISTYKSISKYDVEGRRFVNYYAGDGLQGNEFTHGAFYRASSGKIFFGGVNGITSFLPDAISGESKAMEVWITDFFIFDKPVHKNTISGDSPVIQENVQDAKLFRLAYDDNTFSIIFSTLQYNNPEQITYQYRMEELGTKWLSTEPGVNRVTYNNLPPGKYTFSVRALKHGNYSDIRTVRIVISPPWYETKWAYFIYCLLFIFLVLGTISYIRSRMRHRRELMEREHAEQLNEAKLQFFINISHEIRTPMTLIINPLEKLIADQKDSELHKTYLMIYRNAQRILRLINQLMDIRKLDEGQIFLKFRETDIVGFINDVMTTFDYLARKKKIRFTFEHDMPELKVWIDLNNFDKILMNILSNAFKYTPEEGEVQVALTTGKDPTRKDALKEYFEITVTDSGIGIDKSKIERIFERFYQIDNDVTQSNFGTGIGLHLSRSLVLLHHGIIFAENRTDTSGSRFVIRIPLGAAHLRADELESGESNIKMVSAPLKSQISPVLSVVQDEQHTEEEKVVKPKTHQKVLVVEDEEEILTYLKNELSDEYRIQTCTNGKEAYELMLVDMPDLVISDIMMPEMDGLTLCRKIKQNTNINHIPVVLLTAKSKPEDRLEGMDTGADGYIVKPFNTDLLKSTIANLLLNRRMLRNKFSGTQQQEDKIDKLQMQSGDEKLMEKIMKVVNEHLADPDLNAELLATEVGLSRVHIHRKLKELTNLSARDFIKNIRLQQAAKLLAEDKKLTISEVAYATGYANLSHFSNSFKERYGMSPKDYINKHRKE